MFFILKSTVKKINSQTKLYFVDKLQEYDYMIDKKEAKRMDRFTQFALIAAGGVNLSNAAEYAATGVDGLATTCLHFAKPLDMSVRMYAN